MNSESVMGIECQPFDEPRIAPESLRNQLGDLDIFMTPVGQNPDGSLRYEAVFS